MREHLAEIPTDKPVVLFCAVGLRGYLSLRILMGRGYRNVRNLIGGYKTYSMATAPLPSPSAPAGGDSSSASSAASADNDDVPAAASVSKGTVEDKRLRLAMSGTYHAGEEGDG